MDFKYEVTVSVERTEGKFAGRDELEEALQSEIEGADPGSVSGDAGGEYEVTSWEVEAVDVKPSKGKKAALGDGSVDSRPLGKIPELKALAGAWYHLNQKPDDPANIARFEHTMEAAFQLIAGTME